MTPDERAKALLAELDSVARGVCRYEFGLPIGMDVDDADARMVKLVADAIRAAVDDERERCAAIAETFETQGSDGPRVQSWMRHAAWVIASRIRAGRTKTP